MTNLTVQLFGHVIVLFNEAKTKLIYLSRASLTNTLLIL